MIFSIEMLPTLSATNSAVPTGGVVRPNEVDHHDQPEMHQVDAELQRQRQQHRHQHDQRRRHVDEHADDQQEAVEDEQERPLALDQVEEVVGQHVGRFS
jgi:ABC-type nickel/cobalt efflux system permease component RcnA